MPSIILRLTIISAILASAFLIPTAAGSSFSGHAGDSGAADLAASAPSQTPDSIEIIFTKSAQTLGNTRSMGVAVADVDMDGDNDIFMCNYIGPSRLWLNDGTGFFSQSPQSFDISVVHCVAIEDLNGDTYPDIFLLSHANPSKVYFNDGSGTFTPGAQNIGVGTDDPGMLVLGDVDGDTDLDAFISYYLLPNRLWLNNGEGFFSLTDTEYGEGSGNDMQLADVNGDTYLDLFLCLGNQPDEIWLNDGSGNFQNSGQALGNSTGYEHVSAGDVEGDGDIDFAVDNSVEGVKIWLNQNNTGILVEAGPYFGGAALIAKLFDADLDGDLDLITAHWTNGNQLWRNDGSAVFTSLGLLFGSARAFRVACGKLDGDDDYDVVFGMEENSGGNPIYFNESVHIEPGTCGDANGDKSINILDVGYLISYLYKGGSAPDPSQIADVDHSGGVNILDVGYTISYLYKGGPAPNCPSTVK